MTNHSTIYLDCDTGIDDALAIGYLTSRPDVHLAGVGIVSGNIDAAQGAQNTLDLLSVLGDDHTPVAVGQRDFLTRPYHGGAPEVHGTNGIGGVQLPHSARAVADLSAAELLVELAHRHAHELRVLAIGPLTNLALALQLDPDIATLVKDVVIMGGAFLAPGNVTAHAEANIHNDPEAADAVFAAAWDITVVPLDVTTGHRFEEHHLRQLLDSPSFPARVIGQMMDTYFDFYATVYGRRVAILHDPLAAAILDGESAVTKSFAVPVLVRTDEGERGRTVADLRTGAGEASGRRAATIVLAVDAPFAPVLVERLTTLQLAPADSVPTIDPS
ncbi:nucleoside hydrolase [Plantibacter sp. Mn2098]|uniref:nucleoside hydrolase n=1 Tax=Plantibacter sp. Mn2098 TaxID=3395266 RepID=UPI003BE32B77